MRMMRIFLPLYTLKAGKKVVCEKSGLNQWNASGRKRNEDELYIPVPRMIHKSYPDFFPERNKNFILLADNNVEMIAKICQDNGKALMSNPNKILGRWMLRDILNIPPGKIIKYEDLLRQGFDSVAVTKQNDITYYIEPCSIGAYEKQFI